jgi:type IV pilus assembly protein PilM
MFRPPMVGLDIGSGAVKAVSLRKTRAGWSLVGAAELPLPLADASRGQSQQDASLAGAVSDAFGALRLRRARVATALSGHAVIVKRLSLPTMSNAELADAIPWEAEQYIPFDLNDVQLDYQVVTPPAGEAAKATVDVLLVAAKRDRIEDRTALVTDAGQVPVVLDVEAFALANAYQMNYPERTDPMTALIHIGRNATLVCMLDRGEPIFTRDIALGGQLHVEAVRKATTAQAIDDMGVLRILRGQMPPNVDADQMTKVMHDASAQLVLEIRKTIEFFQATAPIERLTRVILSGGAWEAAGLVDQLTHEFNAPVDVFDPFRKVARPKGVTGSDANGPAFAVAVGLAMRQEGDR